jgi:hypothetical protein
MRNQPEKNLRTSPRIMRPVTADEGRREEKGSQKSKGDEVDQFLREKPVHHHPRILADWINLTGAVPAPLDRVGIVSRSWWLRESCMRENRTYSLGGGRWPARKCATSDPTEIRTSGLMSGDGKRGGASASVLAPILDSTNYTATIQFERVLSICLHIGHYPSHPVLPHWREELDAAFESDVENKILNNTLVSVVFRILPPESDSPNFAGIVATSRVVGI